MKPRLYYREGVLTLVDYDQGFFSARAGIADRAPLALVYLQG
jgi:hypothetical protein